MRGQPIDPADSAAAAQVLATYDGIRGKYWPAVAWFFVGIVLPAVRLLGTQHHGSFHPNWFGILYSVAVLLLAARWAYRVHRIRRFHRS